MSFAITDVRVVAEIMMPMNAESRVMSLIRVISAEDAVAGIGNVLDFSPIHHAVKMNVNSLSL